MGSLLGGLGLSLVLRFGVGLALAGERVALNFRGVVLGLMMNLLVGLGVGLAALARAPGSLILN